ncbi:MAG: hypothetical protein ABIG20_01970 [archaeon]
MGLVTNAQKRARHWIDAKKKERGHSKNLPAYSGTSRGRKNIHQHRKTLVTHAHSAHPNVGKAIKKHVRDLEINKAELKHIELLDGVEDHQRLIEIIEAIAQIEEDLIELDEQLLYSVRELSHDARKTLSLSFNLKKEDVNQLGTWLKNSIAKEVEINLPHKFSLAMERIEDAFSEMVKFERQQTDEVLRSELITAIRNMRENLSEFMEYLNKDIQKIYNARIKAYFNLVHWCHSKGWSQHEIHFRVNLHHAENKREFYNELYNDHLKKINKIVREVKS